METDKRRECDGCIYMGWCGWYKCCNYIFIKGESRPCPPGKDCTVKVTRKRKRRKNNGQK